MHPLLFELPLPWGDQPVFSYGVMLGTALLVAWFTIMRLGEREPSLRPEIMRNTFLITAVSAIVFARLLYAVTNLAELDSLADVFDLQGGGLVAYGGFFGGLLGSWAFLRAKSVSLLAWADVVAPTLGVGLGLVRIGCYLYGCDFGVPLGPSAPSFLRRWGTFPRWTIPGLHGSPAWSRHVAAYDLSPFADYSQPVHPTQIYESMVGFLLAGVAFFVWSRREFRGQVILVVATLYGVWRFLIEYVRDDPERGFYLGFSTSQLISLGLVPACAFLYLELCKHHRAEAAVGEEPSGVVDAPAHPPPPQTKKRKRKRKRQA